ncbi:MAG: hypothetical protein NVS2B14_00200 [Chamaesiphon sp.]
MKVTALKANGSLVDINQCWVVEKAIGRKLDWQEIQGSREEAGSFFQAYYEIMLSDSEALIAKEAIKKYQDEIGDWR